jgi:DNA modification methylase
MPRFENHNALKPFPMEKESVQAVITSPPYFALRNYKGHPDQIGQELCPEDYVAKMMQVADNVYDVLAKDGVFWLNIGDTYDKNKSLYLIPHRVAIAMRDSKKWFLRNTVVWHKPNHMPSSIKDRLTPSHEYVFMFAKQRKYYFDLDAIRVPHETLQPERFLDRDGLAAKLGTDVGTVKIIQEAFEGVTFDEKKGYENTKLEGESILNQGARGGFHQNGEHMENRYSDGGKNPGDVFVQEKKFTHEDEMRAVEEWGLMKGKSARVTARLMMGYAKSHPLGKNPGDVHSPKQEDGTTNERTSGESLWMLDGFDLECPECGSQFATSVDEFRTTNPEDLWHVSTASFKDSHYAVFPPKLVERMIKCSSRQGDVVLDCFAGSGTTAYVSEQLGRIGVGFDLSYNDVRERRVAGGIQQALILE